jgi:short-subunit dehydrogenase
MPENMEGRVVVITGAAISSIGQVAAEKLAAIGARIVQVARDRERGQAAMARLNQVASGISYSIHYADLLRLSEMKREAEIAQAEPRIDVLINNAGAMFGTRQPERAIWTICRKSDKQERIYLRAPTISASSFCFERLRPYLRDL